MTNDTDPAVRPFQVDLRGVVDLLSRHIYSSPQVFLRELLQNGRDAIRARHDRDPAAPDGVLDVEPATDGRPFRFRDNGVGLTAAEAAELLSTVGRSSKRDDLLQVRRADYLGQFGIGLLSCFLVSDRIVVRSRSASGAPPVEWVGDASGSFALRELAGAEADAVPVGTEVVLDPRPDDAALLGPARVRALAARYGEYLPVVVRVGSGDGTSETVTRAPVFLDAVAEEPSDALLDLGAELLGRRPLGVVPLSVPGTGTSGVAFVLPFAPPPGARQTSRVYLGRMLVGERLDGILPDWAFFVRCVIDTTGLSPTASREAFVEDTALEHTREQLGQAVRGWILRQATTRPWVLQEFLAVHQLALKAMSVHDDELARAVLPWLTVETSAGPATLDDLARRHERIRYAETVDEFRQVAQLVPADAPVVNGGYSYDAALLGRLPELLDVPVARVTVGELLDELAPPPLADRGSAVALEERATRALAEVGCTVAARGFSPPELPALCVLDPDVVRRIERDGARHQAAGGVWGDVLGDVSALIEARREAEGVPAAAARLCLNWASPLVRRLARLDDALVFDRTVKLLYVQALLAAHRPLAPADRRMLTSALTDMVALSAGVADDLDGGEE